jgi:hypothetical protein
MRGGIPILYDERSSSVTSIISHQQSYINKYTDYIYDDGIVSFTDSVGGLLQTH